MGCSGGVIAPSVQASCRCRTTAGTSSAATSSCATNHHRTSSSSLPQLRPPWSTRPPTAALLSSLQFLSSSQSVVTSMRCCSVDYYSHSELPAPFVKQQQRLFNNHGLDNNNNSNNSSSNDRKTSRVRIARHTRRRRIVAANIVPDVAETSADLEAVMEQSLAEDADVSSISEWELDFCSRPILDARGKKLWEIVVCDNRRQLQFACFYPNNVINSITLRDALASIVETLGVPKPEKIRFFRSQMQTIISKACKELDIQPVPSQRCITLVRWLEERYEMVYRRHPGFQEGATPLSLQEQALPLDLPDTLRGEQWTFVQLPLSGVLEEMEAVEKGAMFGSVLDLDTLGIDLSSDIMIPGVAVASSRATPLAAWTNALELASIEVDTQRSCLILSTGVADRWRYAFYRKSRQADAEGEAWESAKKFCGGLHFLAVQESLDSELCTGFWLLIDVQRSPV